ncbi:MAG: SGNH/GDSL hydrolase family protein [Anaerolineales bacterium]|nr:SGNH/GDSL hydrolase family protein [Anaerolineales bacterium]
MSYRIKYLALALLLSILLSSCTGASQPTNEPSPLPPIPTSTPSQTIFHLDRSALAYGIFETEATSLTIVVSNTAPGQFKDFTDISIEDASGVTTYEVQSGESTIVHAMPAGKKRVTVTSGLQTKFRNRITGVFINKITFNEPAVRIAQEGKRILVYGDSLAVGGNVDDVSAEAWPVLLRKHFSVSVDAYGYRTLYDDASTVEARSEFAARIASRGPDRIWLAIGANDYAFEQWSAQQFGQTYAATLDAIHSSNSQALLFAQSPILRADESPNVFGDTLEKYRQQIATACLARPAWCRFVNGTNPAFPRPDELDQDGIHLTTKSSAKYAEAVLNIIGK